MASRINPNKCPAGPVGCAPVVTTAANVDHLVAAEVTTRQTLDEQTKALSRIEGYLEGKANGVKIAASAVEQVKQDERASSGRTLKIWIFVVGTLLAGTTGIIAFGFGVAHLMEK